jgi:hypothetical protein
MSGINEGNICAGVELKRIEIDRPYYEMYQAQVWLQERVGALPRPERTLSNMAHNAIYWHYCITDECFELLEWLETPKSETTEKEMRMEAIDILHFVFNLGIELNMTGENVETVLNYFPFSQIAALKVAYNTKTVLSGAVLRLLQSITNCISHLPWKNWKKYDNLPEVEKVLGAAQSCYCEVLANTITICCLLNMLEADIIDYYFAKNNENHARQDRGY